MPTKRAKFLLLLLPAFSSIAAPFSTRSSSMGRAKGNHRKQENIRKHMAALASARLISHMSLHPEPEEPNFVSDAGPGCHIARPRSAHSMQDQDEWILGWEAIDPQEYGDDENDVPDVAIDPDSQYTLTLCNVRDKYVVAYITLYDHLQLCDKHNKLLAAGTSSDKNGVTRSCTTLIILCPPRTFAHLGRLVMEDNHENISLENLPLESDVSIHLPHPHPNDTHSQSIAFPLGNCQYLCTQGEDGILTHFLAGNHHAIDLECRVGTPLLAVGSGIVIDLCEDNTLVSGIAVSNLYNWNSIMLKLDTDDVDDPLFVEYVHAQSFCVSKGDRVECGQVIGASGSVGFSPRPHLHLAAYRSAKPTAPTVRVFFRAASDKSLFLPRAGLYYNADGPVHQEDCCGDGRVEEGDVKNNAANMPQS
ncbi:hypothetical protein MPSEU_000881100 [Mayamaea pseudoterrestris]|nr:hypothetical protein MPSEU_000881100 [Mayamaea pseudoterrestris]